MNLETRRGGDKEQGSKRETTKRIRLYSLACSLSHLLPCSSSGFTLHVLLWLLLGSQSVFAAELSGYIATDGRLFTRDPLAEIQHEKENLSILFELEFYHEWANGDMSLALTPYFRLDQHDSERTHFDLREFFWQKVGNSWELRVGVAVVFWGVTESQHLVDIINQTDLVENPDGEDKLGQPMVNFSWIADWGTLDLFAMPFFRERTFPGEEGRLRFPLVVDTDQATYESGAEEYHVDVAARWSHTLGNFDVGVSHFYGTSRDPRLLPSAEDAFLAPHYDLIHQTGLDLQFTSDAWLLKSEVINRSGQGDRFFALTSGFEYTFSNMFNSGVDIGIVGEYLFDERGDEATTPFEDDLFIGVRLALNDVQSTSLLVGAIIDRETGSNSVGVEGNRRLWESWTVDVEARAIIGTERTELLHGLRKDDYVQVQLARHF